VGAMTVRNLSDEFRRALKQRAKDRGVSAEAEARRILEEAVLPKERVNLVDLLVEFGRKHGPLPYEQDKTPYEPIKFE